MNDSSRLTETPEALIKSSRDNFAPLPDYAYGAGRDASEGIPLRNYWRSIRKRKWLVILMTVTITTLVLLYVARQPDIYEAEARVQIDQESSSPVRGAFKNAPVVVNNTLNDVSYFNTQLENLSSAGLLRRAVKTLDLEHNNSFFKSQVRQTRSTWQSLLHMIGVDRNQTENEKAATARDSIIPPKVAPASARGDVEEAMRLQPYVEAIQKDLTVKQINATRLIKISYYHHDSRMAAKVVNAIVDAFVLSNLEMQTETNTSTGDFLIKRIAELQSQIRTGEEQLINYAKSNQILTLDQNQNTVVERLVGLNRQLLDAEHDRKIAEAAYRAASAPGAAEALSEETAKRILDADAKLAELRQKRAQLLVDNTEEWPEVKEVNQQISVLEKQVQDARTRATTTVVTNLETRYRQALAREQALRTSFDQQKTNTLIQNEAAVNYRIIQQEIETNKSLLDGLLQRSKENDVELAGTANNIHINEYAVMSKSPVGPRRLLTVTLALIVSLAFGIFLALFAEYLDDTVRSTEDVDSMLHLPTLAVIPAVGGLSRRRLLRSRNGLQSLNGNGSGSGHAELLISETNTRSSLAEAFRQLRTSVLLSTAGRAPKSLLVTSSVAAEGKTTTSLNTAFSLGQTGASVLLIDADLRRPQLHNLLGTGNERGLSTILSSEMSEAEILSLIHQDQASGLHLLTSGPIPPNPAELIGSAQMRRLLATVESTFTHIVIDSPPIASFTDGVLLSSLVDGVLLVVHGGKSSRNVVQRSRQLLLDVGAKIFGVVLNRIDARSEDYYYYHSYYKDSYYKDDAEEISVVK